MTPESSTASPYSTTCASGLCVHIGCGDKRLDGWLNVDITEAPAVDMVLDATKPWPLRRVKAVFAEHFLEHLTLAQALSFLEHAWGALDSGGSLRLSTPSLEWVWLTHFAPSSEAQAAVMQTLSANRAFRGWGHQFLYSRPMLSYLLAESGWEQISFCRYGESSKAVFNNVERHRRCKPCGDFPAEWIVEAVPCSVPDPPRLARLRAFLAENYFRYTGCRQYEGGEPGDLQAEGERPEQTMSRGFAD